MTMFKVRWKNKYVVVRVANFREMKFGTPRSRRGMERGFPLPSRLGGLRERRELPQRGIFRAWGGGSGAKSGALRPLPLILFPSKNQYKGGQIKA